MPTDLTPIFTETASDIMTAEVAAQLSAAIATIPSAHCLSLEEYEPSKLKNAAFVRLQNWAFTKGSTLVKESAKMKNGQFYRRTIANWKLEEDKRKHAHTHTQANG